MAQLPVYKSWPGLTNPQADVPILPLRPRWLAACTKRRAWRTFRQMVYRSWRAITRFIGLVVEEFTETPARSIIEFIVGLPAVLLIVDPYREWVGRQPKGWWAIAGFAVLS